MVKCLRFPVTDEACKFKHVLITTVELLFEPLFEDVKLNRCRQQHNGATYAVSIAEAL